MINSTIDFLIVLVSVGSFVLALELIVEALEKRQARKEVKSKITNVFR